MVIRRRLKVTSAIKEMLDSYKCRTADDYPLALNEIVQEISLLGLYRGGFFSRAAFYGGTALHLFHGLDRLSQDLDFTLTRSDKSFDLSAFLQPVRDELGAYGLQMTVSKKTRKSDSPVKSAFIKGGTQIQLLRIVPTEPVVSGIHPDELIKIKFEVDTDPPAGADFEMKYQLLPVPFSVRLYSLPSLFAGKVHALLCRSWKTRVKGRDFYDYVWFLSKGIPLNMAHLEARMRQTGHMSLKEVLTEDAIKTLLKQKFLRVDYAQAKRDVAPFIKNLDVLDIWSTEFFSSITTDKLKFERSFPNAQLHFGKRH